MDVLLAKMIFDLLTCVYVTLTVVRSVSLKSFKI